MFVPTKVLRYTHPRGSSFFTTSLQSVYYRMPWFFWWLKHAANFAHRVKTNQKHRFQKRNRASDKKMSAEDAEVVTSPFMVRKKKMKSGQIIMTSAEVTLNCGLVRGSPQKSFRFRNYTWNILHLFFDLNFDGDEVRWKTPLKVVQNVSWRQLIKVFTYKTTSDA